jgi:hypothetical protein
MKYLTRFLFLVTFSFINHLTAQSLGEHYNNLVNEAELNITQGDYKKALNKYNEAYTAGVGFGVDLYNAAVCAHKEKNTKQVLAFADKLADKGVGAKFFKRKVFESYISDTAFRKVIHKAEKVRKEKMQANSKYLAGLNEFGKRDSTYNRLRLTKYHDEWQLPDTLENLFRDNTRNMLDYIKKNGFYSEEKLGINIASDTLFRETRRPDIVFLHYLEMGRDKNLLDEIKDIYINKMMSGDIKPSFLAGIIALSNQVFGETGGYIFNIFECQIYKLREVPDFDEINRRRKTYLQLSLDDFEKKLVFKYCCNSYFDFHYTLINHPVSKEDYFYSNSDVIGNVKDCKLN